MEFDFLLLQCIVGFAFLGKRNLLGWYGSFVGKRQEKAWRAAPLMLNVDLIEGKD